MFGRKRKKQEKGVCVRVEQLPPEQTIDENKLVEIKDEMILARLNQAVPEIALALSAGGKAAAAAQVAYQAVLPASTMIPPSRETKKAFFGLFRRKGGAVSAVSQAGGSLATATTLLFGVAALIVGQKYMTDIARGLNLLNEGLGKISSFQHNEYKSKVEALVARLTVLLSHKTELQLNDGLCERSLLELSGMEAECAELLGQANETIEGFARVRIADFKKYCERVQEIAPWLEYQNKLLAVLYYISDLKYVLNRSRNRVSRSYCRSLFTNYFERTAKTKGSLRDWHEQEAKLLKIDLAECKRKRGGMDAFLHLLPALVKEENKYRALPEGMGELILEQVRDNVVDFASFGDDPFEQDLEIIIRDGKAYMKADSPKEDRQEAASA